MSSSEPQRNWIWHEGSSRRKGPLEERGGFYASRPGSEALFVIFMNERESIENTESLFRRHFACGNSSSKAAWFEV